MPTSASFAAMVPTSILFMGGSRGVSLFEDVVFYLGRKRAVARLQEESGGGEPEALRVGVVLSLPVVIGNLGSWVEKSEQAEWLSGRLVDVPSSLANDLDALLEANSVTELSNDVLDLVLGEDGPRVVDRLAARAQVQPDYAAQLLSITTSAVLAHLAANSTPGPSPDGLRDVLAADQRDLEAGGWEPWIDETAASSTLLVPLAVWEREKAVGAAVDTSVEHVSPERTRAEALEASAVGYPPPRPSTRGVASDTPDPVVDDGPLQLTHGHEPEFAGHTNGTAERPAPIPAAVGGQATHPGLGPEPAVLVELDEGNGWFSRPGNLLLMAGFAVVVALIAFSFLGRGDDGTVGEVVADDPAGEEAGSPTTASGDDAIAASVPDEGAASTAVTDVVPDGPRRLIVPMIDPLGITDGTGNANLDFDPVTGEICYEFTIDGINSPYDGHIHVGPPGVKGGIVVDFGLLDGATSGCIANSPADTAAILADLGGHYAEFHDADGVATVRAQLGEPQLGGPAGESSEQDSGGAFARIEPGRLVLTGEVPDQVTIDKYLETFADLDPDSIEIVNELEIVPGAPRPSGRILVDDTVFFEFDSAELVDPETTVLRDLATIFEARPAWRMTVVGHTDSVGTDVYNLELSLRRATAVRDALVVAGVAAEVLTVEGAGSTAPIAPNDTEAGRSQNRRIEVEVIPG